jgi:hypothetical protein
MRKFHKTFYKHIVCNSGFKIGCLLSGVTEIIVMDTTLILEKSAAVTKRSLYRNVCSKERRTD